MYSLIEILHMRKNWVVHAEIVLGGKSVLQINCNYCLLKNPMQAYKYFSKIFELSPELHYILGYMRLTIYVNIENRYTRFVFDNDKDRYYQDLTFYELDFIGFLCQFRGCISLYSNEDHKYKIKQKTFFDISHYLPRKNKFYLRLYTSKNQRIGILTSEDFRESFPVEHYHGKIIKI